MLAYVCEGQMRIAVDPAFLAVICRFNCLAIFMVHYFCIKNFK